MASYNLSGYSLYQQTNNFIIRNQIDVFGIIEQIWTGFTTFLFFFQYLAAFSAVIYACKEINWIGYQLKIRSNYQTWKMAKSVYSMTRNYVLCTIPHLIIEMLAVGRLPKLSTTDEASQTTFAKLSVRLKGCEKC